MTAVAVQHNPSNYPYIDKARRRSDSNVQNGTSSATNGKLSNGASQDTEEESSDRDQFPPTSTEPFYQTNSAAYQDRRLSLQNRPTSAPGINEVSSQDESERERPRRRPKPLLRAKSDFGPRGENQEDEEEIQDWGARHGFEVHYASEEYVSQLANVSCTFPKVCPPLPCARLL
jgi:regulator-associated protein of mTOR